MSNQHDRVLPPLLYVAQWAGQEGSDERGGQERLDEVGEGFCFS
jgi:hypothetical protein